MSCILQFSPLYFMQIKFYLNTCIWYSHNKDTEIFRTITTLRQEIHFHLLINCNCAWTPHIEEVQGNRRKDPCNINLGATWRSLLSYTPRPLYTGRKSPWYPLGRRLGGPQSRSGRDVKRRISDHIRNRTPIVHLAVLKVSNSVLNLTVR